MSVLKAIFAWSKTCPEWQRDALRRLVQNATLSNTDFAELALICRSVHGALPVDKIAPASEPVSEHHLPPEVRNDQSVTLTLIEEVQHVNAIVGKRPLVFGESGLTVIYGDNAS